MAKHLIDTGGADLSPCRTYRYALWRNWDWSGHANRVMFIGINPSTADETKDDQTIRKCRGFASRWGYGGILMMNLYAFRARHPGDMVQSADPVGPGNDEAFGYRRTQCGLIVACWGRLEMRYRPRVQWQSRIQQVLDAISRPVQCLGLCSDGSPRHPVLLGYDTPLEPFWVPPSACS